MRELILFAVDLVKSEFRRMLYQFSWKQMISDGYSLDVSLFNSPDCPFVTHRTQHRFPDSWKNPRTPQGEIYIAHFQCRQHLSILVIRSPCRNVYVNKTLLPKYFLDSHIQNYTFLLYNFSST